MELQINIGNQPHSVMRVLDKFGELTARAFNESGKLGLYSDGLPLVIVAIANLYPKMRRKRRLQLAAHVFDIVQNMHRLMRDEPPTETRQ